MFSLNRSSSGTISDLLNRLALEHFEFTIECKILHYQRTLGGEPCPGFYTPAAVKFLGDKSGKC